MTTTMTPLAKTNSHARLTAAAVDSWPEVRKWKTTKETKAQVQTRAISPSSMCRPRACRTSLSTAGPGSPGPVRAPAAAGAGRSGGRPSGRRGHPGRPSTIRPWLQRARSGRSGRGRPSAGAGGLARARSPVGPPEGFPPLWRFSALH